MIDAMFDGLEDDHLKVVMEVLYGLKDETSLDEFRRMNEQNLSNVSLHILLPPLRSRYPFDYPHNLRSR